MNTEVMLDLETLGNKPRSVIVAIGAVKLKDGVITDRFYKRVDAASCVQAGLRVDVDTVMWWLKQESEARLEITKPGDPLSVVLWDFAEWLGCTDAEVWGNGAAFDNVLLADAFDNVLLADAYDACSIQRPWKFWNDRCHRTMKSLFPQVPMQRSGTHHNALHDAETQAVHLMAIRKHTLSKTLHYHDATRSRTAA